MLGTVIVTVIEAGQEKGDVEVLVEVGLEVDGGLEEEEEEVVVAVGVTHSRGSSQVNG